jgi:GMP synthase (glutamine-hydrolysing)
MSSELCLIVDFGSQYTQLIARKLREVGVKSEVVTPKLSLEQLEAKKPLGLILSGGPSSVFEENAPKLSFSVNDLRIPVLGICYGMQWMVQEFGGKVIAANKREYGVEKIIIERGRLFETSGENKNEMNALMSHGDHAEVIPEVFRVVARTTNGVPAAIEHLERALFGLQFHPEVHHTERGLEILRKFLVACRFHFDWKPENIFEEMGRALKEQVAKKGADSRILCALSGGVDSSVVAVALNKLFPGRVDCLCVDTGLLRKNELTQLAKMFESKFKFPIQLVDASKEFIGALKGIRDPEQKRKTIGRLFIEIFEREAKKLKNIQFLAQGTLYPDVIESISFHGGPSAKIKSHHNVGGLPERLPFELIEPLRDLFKDEARRLGEFLGLPREFVWRHPFPGPALAIRIMGDVTEERLHLVREADERLQEVLKSSGWYEKLWQSFCVYLPIQSVGVMGDQRTYEDVMAVRCVHSEDGMTAHIAPLPTEVLEKISSRIINEVKGINRVVYDISSKPPATIEWE